MRRDRSAKLVAQSLRRGACNGGRKIRLIGVNKAVSISAAIAIALAPTLTQAQQLPTGGSVAAGSATISAPNSNTLNVNQSSNRAVINWSSFSIGQGGTVNFNQPSSSSATLNRVTGSTPSSIAGTINAPGTVLLVNPNGIAITSSGVVNVGSFAASTLDIKNSDFMSGNYKFSGNGASAAVTNAGRINVSDGGFAALLGGQVANDGVISARLGRVGLGSGELITLDLSGDGFLSVAVPTSSLGGIVGSDGHPLVSNKGKIVADGGMVYLSAATAAGLLRDAVYVPGSIRANSVGTSNGKIVIGGGAGGKVKIAGKLKANGSKTAKGGKIDVSGAQVAVSGKVSAKGTSGGTVKLTASDKVDVSGTVAATGTTGSGGVVVVTADQVTLGDTAKLDASGATGGTLLIGGDYQGGANTANNFSIEVIKNALTTSVAAGATLTAEGTAGDGGKIVVWSDDKTTFAGAISATGAGTGKGGFAEVSGHRLLVFTGTANLTGPGGFGTLLLDPRNVTISSSTTSNGALSGGTFTPSADNSVLNVATLQAALASGNVVVTTGSTGSQSGDITVASAITWAGANTLTLTAANNIAINANITAVNGGLTINAAGGVTATGAINVGQFTLQSGNWVQNSSTLPSFAATSFTINGGSFLRVTGGDGTSGTPYQIADVYGLQGIGSSSAYLSASWQLANNIDASGTANWNGGAGFVPLGTDGAGNVLYGSGFSGNLDGQYHLVDGLAINRVASRTGLIGYQTVGAVSKIGLTNVNIAGASQTGGLVGWLYSGSVSDSFVTGRVSGGYQVGGLIGQIEGGGSILRTYAQAYVSGTGASIAGLVGQNSGSISQSYATGRVTGTGASGLANSGGGTVTNSYYDTLTFGSTNGTGTGYVTTQMQSGLPTGFDSNWSIVAGRSYAYLTGFYNGTPQVISGSVYNSTGSTALAGEKVSALINGANAGSIYSGANGYFNILLPSGSIGANSQIATYTTGANAGVTYQQDASGSQSGMSITAGWLSQTSAAASMSAISAGLATAIGSSGVSTTLANRFIVATNANFTLDEALTHSGSVRISAGGSVTQNAGASISANALRLSLISGGANFTLLDAGNSFATLGSSNLGTGSLNLYDSAALSIGGAITANGGLLIQTAGNLTLNNTSTVSSSTSGDAVVLVAGGTFTNSSYSNALTAANGRWLIYASTPTGSSFNNLNSGNDAVWNATYASNAPSTIASGNRYVFAFQPTVTFTSTNASKYYGASADVSSNYTVSSNVSAVTNAYTVASLASLYSGTPTVSSVGTATTATVAGGPYAIDIAQGSVVSTGAYALNFASSGLLTVNKASLIIYTGSANKTYGTTYSSTTNFTTSGLLNGDTVTSADLASAGAAATADVGNYTLTASNAQGSGLSNYNLLYSAGNLQVGQAVLSITAANASKQYGLTQTFAGTEFTVSGLVNGDTVSAVSLTSTGAAATANVGGYQINVSNATGAKISNYLIYYNNGSLSVTPAPLTITANNQSKTYGSTYNLGSTDISVTGTLYNSDAVTGATLTSGATSATAAAGFQTLYVSNATGTGLSNYTITYVNANLTVNAAPLTITASDQSKTYGTNLGLGSTGYTVTSGTLFNGDTVTGVTLASAGANAAATVAGGPYAINASNAQGSALYNYTITYLPGSLTVNPASLTVTANNASKTYNGVAFTGGNGVSYSGFVNGETTSVLGGTLAYGGTAQNTKDAGVYSITASGQTASNYTISYQPGTLTVGQAALTVTANSQNKTYGTEITFAGTEFTKTGTLYGSDSIDSVTLTGAGAAATANAAGVPYTIVASNVQGTGVGNYAITYVAGNMMVFPKALTVTADNTSKVYGTTLGSTGTSGFTTSGLVNSDSVDSVTFSGSGLAGTASVNVYQLNVGGASGTGLSNYSITYNPGQLTVTAAPLTVTANNQSKTYGSTYNLGSTDISVTGTLYNSDVITGATLTSGATSATAAAGFQTLYVSNATGTGVSNYNITYVAGRLTVNQAPLTITANDASKTYGINLGLGSTAYTSTGTLYNGDTLTGVTLTSAGAGAGAAVTGSAYAITPSAAQGNGLYNYAITYVNGALTVNPAALTVTANNASKTYNGVAFTGGNGVSYSGFVNGQDATVLGGTLSYGGTAQNAKDAGTYSITASGQTSSNYTISYQPGTLTVNQAALTVKANDQSKSYGTAFNFTGTEFTTTGTLYGSDSISSVTLASAGVGATANAAGVPYTITASNAQGTGVGNYAITYANGGMMVYPKALTITADNTSKVYGSTMASAATSGFTASGLVNSDSVTSVSFSSSGLAGTAPVSVYQLNAGGAAGSGLSNYSITYNPGTLIVTPAPLTVTATNQSKTYGTAYDLGSTAFTTTGTFYNGDSISGVTLTSGAAAASAAAGAQIIYASNATGTGVSNYSITYNNAILTVNQAQLTVTANDVSKTYGTSLALGGSAFTVSGTLYNGDTVTSTTLSSTGTFAGATVAGGPYTITPSGAQGSGLYNYVITYANGALTVNPAALTVTANNATKTYDGAAFTGGNGVSYSGFVNGQDATVLGGTLSYGGTAQTAKDAGNYSIVASGQTSSNYTISYQPGTLTINKATLTYVADAASMSYGGTVPALGGQVTGFKGSDTLVNATSGALAWDTTATSASNAGSYSITGSGLTATNYTFSQAAANSTAFTITPSATLVYVADTASRTYGDANPSFTGTVIGFVNGDTLTTATTGTAVWSTTATASSNAGSYGIVGSGLVSANYAFVQASGNAAALTVNQRAITVTATAQSKAYDNNAATDPALTYTVGGLGLVSGDSLGGSLTRAAGQNAGSYAIGQGTLANANYAISYTGANFVIDPRAITVAANAQSKTYDNNAATDPALTYTVGGLGLVSGDSLTGSLTRAAGESAGSYAIGQGTVANSNYAITYTGANFVINQRAITVAADAQAKTYDNNAATDPALTYTVGGLGLVSGDSLAGSLTRAAGENAGSYAIGQGTVANSNYAITYTGANFVIDPRAVTVAANAQSKTYDNNAATDPALTYTVGGLGLVSGDSLGGSLTRVAGQNAGSYAIGQGTLANANYAISYTGANFIISPRAVTVAANAQSKTYDNNAATDPALTYTVGGLGLVSGDSLTGSLTRAAGENAGSYAIGQGTLANSNYAITYTGANFVIDPRAITVAANAQSKTYDNNAATDPALTYTVGGAGLVAGDALGGALTRTTGQNVGSYAIGQGTVANSNYAITYTGANFVIDPRAVTVAANAQSKTYDNNAATDPALTYTVGGLGLVSGDSLTGSLTRAAGENAGNYAIGQGTVANSNYAITYTGANFVIDQRAITVTAGAQAKTYGDADPTLSYNVSGGSLVAGDSLAGTLARAAGENVGNYAINQGTLANANYAITFAGANLSIGQRAITVTADAQSKQAGQADPAFTYQVTTGNLVGGDTLTGALSRLAGESVGTYAIQQGTLAASSNYTMAFVGANLQIVDAPVVATNTNGYEPAIYQPRTPGGTLPLVNVSYQFGGNTNAPAIAVVTTPVVSNSPAANQNIAPAGGQSDLFWPISQFDKSQYANATLPDFAAQAGETTVLAMIARAAENNRQAPLIDQLWTNGANWNNPTNRAAGRVTFTDGNGQTRTPGVDSGFPFVNGITDVAALLQNGPLMLGGAKPTDPAQPASWLLAIKLTDDSKHIVANDPVTGSQIVLAYDPATKMVGGVTGQVDKTSRAVVPLDAAAPPAGLEVPADAWNALKAFSPQSFFAVTM